MVMEHGNKFHEGRLKLIGTNHVGFELTETYRCTQCTEELIKRCSFDVNAKSDGRRSVDFNMSMDVEMYASATNFYKINELYSGVSGKL